MIVNALAGKPLPIYGDGMQVRDWLYVKDHCSAIRRVVEAGRLGETYNVVRRLDHAGCQSCVGAEVDRRRHQYRCA